jgi:hypothetical protein
MAKYCTLFLLLFFISACHNSTEEPVFPIPYTWKDSVIDYTFNGKELKFSFPGGTLSKKWLFEIKGRYDSVDFLYIKPTYYYSANGQFIIPVTKSDSLNGKNVLFMLWAAPGDCLLWFNTGKGKYFLPGRERYYERDGKFYLDDDAQKREWVSFPDSLLSGKDSTEYGIKMATFLHNKIDHSY